MEKNNSSKIQIRFPSHSNLPFSMRSLLFLSAALIGAVSAVDKTKDKDLNVKLSTAPTSLDRNANLPKNEDWIFDFTTSPYYTFTPGGVVNANAATFPAATGYGLTMAMLNLGPCAMLPPHFRESLCCACSSQ